MVTRSIICLATVFAAMFSHAGQEHPNAGSGKPTPVYVHGALIDVDAIDDSAQSFTANVMLVFRWMDPRLAHDKDGTVDFDPDTIWTPRIVIVNQQKSWSQMPTRCSVSPDGQVELFIQRWGDFSQPLDLRDFPLDQQECSLSVIAVRNVDEVDFYTDPDSNNLSSDILSIASWSISDWRGKPEEIVLGERLRGDGYIFRFDGRRSFRPVLLKNIFPLILIVFLSWLVFWLDPLESGPQLSVAVTSFLTTIAFHIALTSSLPGIPYMTRMDYFIFGSTILVAMALIEGVLTSRLAKTGNLTLARRMDWVCRAAFPLAYAIILFECFVADHLQNMG